MGVAHTRAATVVCRVRPPTPGRLSPLIPVLRPIVANLLAVAALAAVAAAQVRIQLGAVAPGPGTPGPESEDGGVAVDLNENPNLDPYLRRAKQCIERGDFAAAIHLLQDVIEGRSEDAVTGAAGTTADPATIAPLPVPAEPASPLPTVPVPPLAGQKPGKQAAPAAPPAASDPRHAVFSQDGRLYRPVRRLCHELIARLPDDGLVLYRATYEVAAAELLQQALDNGSLSALEQVQNRFFATLSGGRALLLLGDRLMQEGRYRAAMLTFRDLQEIYPAALQKELGVAPAWLRFKSAVCLQLAGEAAAARREVDALATAAPDATLRVEGELQAVKELPDDPRFADAAPTASANASTAPFFADVADGLVPLWQHRFRNPEPYKDPKAANGHTAFFDGSATAAMPFAGRYGPSTRVLIAPGGADGLPRALFLEHYRLREADATNGLLLASTDAVDEPPPPRDNQPRVRIATSDFALLRPVDDGERCYVVIGHKRVGVASADVLKASELVAYLRDGLQRAWSSEQWLDGDTGLRDVTFLAAPTVFGERLLLPSLRRGRYALECLERRTGKPLWHTQLHGGGSPFFKAPGCPVVVQGGAALVATNAGCVANVDALTGELRWLRRYERRDPLRKAAKPRPTSRDEFGFVGWSGAFRQDELTGFQPNDLIAHGSVAIVAPVDGDMLLGLDIATGEIAWMFDAATRYAPFGRLRTLVGVAGDNLFALSDTSLVAIGATGGLVEWARELPTIRGPKAQGRGRGAIVGDCVLVPNDREALVFGVDGALRGRLPLPSFGDSREPLAGAVQLVVDGAWLAVGFQGGVELFSTRSALRALAAATAAPRRQADLLARAGDVDGAIAALAAAVAAATDAPARLALGEDLLQFVAEQAQARAVVGDLAGALQLLDARKDLLAERPLRLQWHLARLELCKAHGDPVAHEREQSRLYAYMEGKR